MPNSAGKPLQHRREELGISLDKAARDTNVRAQVLGYIEQADFKHLPARGHITGLVSSYARYLGLDSSAITQAYLEAYDLNEKRASIQNIAAEAKEPSAFSRITRHRYAQTAATTSDEYATVQSNLYTASTEEPTATAEYSRAVRSTGSVKVVPRQTDRFSRVPSAQENSGASRVQSSTYRFGASIYGSTSQLDRAARLGQTIPAEDSGKPNLTGNFRLSTAMANDRAATLAARRNARLHPTVAVMEEADGFEEFEEPEETPQRIRSREPIARGTAQQRATHEPNQNLLSRLLAFIVQVFADTQSRLIGIAVILLVAAVVIAASVLLPNEADSNKILSASSNDEITSVTEVDSTTTLTATNSQPISITIKVKKGSTSTVQVVCDDNVSYNGSPVGKWERDFEATSTLTATFGNASAVVVYQNGEKLEIDLDEEGSGGTISLKVKG